MLPATGWVKTPIYHRGLEIPMSVKNKEPYQQAYYPPVPTRFTCFLRSCLPWQFVRFWVINFRIFRLLMKSNHG